MVGWRCAYVDKLKPPTNHILVAYKNVEGHEHGQLDFHVPTQSWSHHESIGCHDFHQVGIDFGKFFLYVVKIRFHNSLFLRVGFHVGRFAHHILVEM